MTDDFPYTKEAQTLVNILEDYAEDMKDYESSFIVDLKDRFDTYGDEAYVSEKQINWLRSLEKRYA